MLDGEPVLAKLLACHFALTENSSTVMFTHLPEAGKRGRQS